MTENIDKTKSLARDLKTILKSTSPAISEIYHAHIHLGWGWDGIGFGELYVRYSLDKAEFFIDDERMGKEATRKILYALADHIVEKMP